MKSNINPNAGVPIEDQLKSAFNAIDEPQVKVKAISKPAAAKPTVTKPTVVKSIPKPEAIKTAEPKRAIPLSNDIRKLIHRDNSGETLSIRDYCKKVIRLNETVTLGHLLAEEGKAFTEKSILCNYGDSCNSVAHSMALCEIEQEHFMFEDKEVLMLIGAEGNSVAHLIAKSGNIERMSFKDIEIFGLKNDKGESVASLLSASGVKFSNKAFDPIRKEIFEIINA
jgi:hypothetical protein